jgi:glycosyltransferase domain-containing protein
MRIEDPDCFVLVVPTLDGTPFLRRTLEHLREIGYPGLIVIADDSSGPHRTFVAAVPAAFPELWLEVHEYAPGTRFLPKLLATFERLRSRYVMLCAQDDFVVPAGLEALVAALDGDPGLVAARGRVARFSLHRTGPEGAARVELHRHPMREYLDADPVRRVLDHVRDFAPALYSVHRRDAFARSLRLTDERTQNVIFFQYLSSCITAFLGRIECLDTLYYVRQRHAQSWAARLGRDYEHWPRLIAAPGYSRYYQEFRQAVLELLGQRDADADALGTALDDAYVELVRRSLCNVGAPNAREDAFFARLSERDTPERAQLAAVVDFCLKYPETY